MCCVQAAIFPPQFSHLADPQLELFDKTEDNYDKTVYYVQAAVFPPPFRNLADLQLELFDKTEAN